MPKNKSKKKQLESPRSPLQKADPQELSAKGPSQFERISGAPPHQQDALTVIQQTRISSGPLPEPDVLRRYGDVCEGLDRKIVEEWQFNSAHQRQIGNRLLSMDERMVGIEGRTILVGQIAGATLTILLACIGGYLISKGHDWAGSIMVAVDVAGAVWGIRASKKGQQQQSPESKSDDASEPEPG